MNGIPVIFLIAVILSVIKSIADKKKKSADSKKTRPNPPVRRAPASAAQPGPQAPQKRPASIQFTEGEDPCHDDMLTGSFLDMTFDENHSMFQEDLKAEGFGSEEGEDPCHEDMLTFSSAEGSDLPGTIASLQNRNELLRGIILSEILGRPRAARKPQ